MYRLLAWKVTERRVVVLDFTTRAALYRALGRFVRAGYRCRLGVV